MEYNLEISNLTKQYSGFTLKNVDLQLPKGIIMGLIGENGAGKSTMIKSILGLIPKNEGTIRLFAQEMDVSNEKAIKEQIGVVFDELHFPETLTANNINRSFSHIYKNWDISLFQSYLEKFHLPEKKIIKEFSRGMKMKLGIAAALSHKPKLLILDEATSGLDPVVRNEILDVFLDFIQNEEHSILMSSHITSDLEKICDYITFIQNGEIQFSRSKDELAETFCILKCGTSEFPSLAKEDILGYRSSHFGYEVLMENRSSMTGKYPDFVIDPASLEDIMLFYGKEISLC